ncbi:peroxiredoxin [Gryllotalpicola reticulitermitis]|uniref:thioredoxin-dependent peroxiredoxin n=1 Tax=Gryllotalpicola reticulitermitis TaxID=1184153 RepID=A0ABV8Q7Z1_9MICO
MALESDTEAPDFELPNQFGQPIRLSDYRGKSAVALVFFPLAFSRTCTGEMCELRDNHALFGDADVELIGVSVDSKWTHRAWAEQEGFEFSLLADFWPHGAVAEKYEVFLPEQGYANRATFLIDEQGIIRTSFETAPGEARPLSFYRSALDELATLRSR